MSDENGLCLSANFIPLAEANGYRIVIPAPDELQIDIDTQEDQAHFDSAAEILFRYIAPVSVTEAPSKSGLPCKHITIKLGFAMTDWQRIALQAVLGSDPTRELLSCVQIINGDEIPTLFVELKQ